ncbi:hypothetical protein FOCC_FOCC001033, partial [Frankliniella occidentalis]
APRPGRVSAAPPDATRAREPRAARKNAPTHTGRVVATAPGRDPAYRAPAAAPRHRDRAPRPAAAPPHHAGVATEGIQFVLLEARTREAPADKPTRCLRRRPGHAEPLFYSRPSPFPRRSVTAGTTTGRRQVLWLQSVLYCTTHIHFVDQWLTIAASQPSLCTSL